LFQNSHVRGDITGRANASSWLVYGEMGIAKEEVEDEGEEEG
jgi:hypothetical protein